MIWLLLGLRLASADILFLRFNPHAEQELAAAQKAAAITKEKVIVWPEVSLTDQTVLTSLTQRMDAVEAQRNATSDTAARARLGAEYATLRAEVDASKKQVGADGKSLSTYLDTLSKQKVNLSRLVVSGHDGNADFFGAYGHISAKGLTDAFASHPDVSKNLRSVLLAGCYSNTPGSLEATWQEPIPSVEIVGGYDGSAPKVDKLAGHQYIYNFLTGDQKLAAAKTATEAKQMSTRIIPPELTSNASICLRGARFVKRNSYSDQNALFKQCEALEQPLRAGEALLECYRQAVDPKCANPPDNPHASPLRDYYELMTKAQPCTRERQFRGRFSTTMSPESLIRLIYFKNTLKNYAAINQGELNESSDILKRAGLAPELADKMKHLEKLSRGEVLALAKALRDMNLNITGLGDDDPRVNARLAAESIREHFRSHLVELNQTCVPFSWVDDHSSEPSGCEKGQIGSSVFAALGTKALVGIEERKTTTRLKNELDQINVVTMGQSVRELMATGGSMRQDPVVSDRAVLETAGLVHRRYLTARADAIGNRLRAISAEQALKQMTDNSMATFMRDDLEKARQMQPELDRIVEHANPFDLDKLRNDRRALFAAADLAVRSTPEAKRAEAEEGQKAVDRLIDIGKDLPPGPGRDSVQRALDEARTAAANLNKEAEEEKQHRAYIKNMQRVLESNPTDRASQDRVIEIAQERAKAVRGRTIDYLNKSISNLTELIDLCGPRNCRFDEDPAKVRDAQAARLRALEATDAYGM